MTRINPNSSIRSGYKFEDLFVLKLCADWLIHTESLREIRIQYVPDEIENSRFSIDDIVTIDLKGKHQFYQIKHRQHSNKDLWDFETLFNKGLEKWISSYLSIGEKIHAEGFLISNGLPDKDVEACLFAQHLNYKKIASAYPWVITRLRKKYTVKQVQNFFKEFTFKFSYPSKVDFEKQIREELYYDLKATKDGVNNLLLFIGDQGADSYPKKFVLKEIRALLSWDNPRPLSQNFEVPTDFEFFDKVQHDTLLYQIQNEEQGIHVIFGKPGAGKSTYLAKLYELLSTKLNCPAVRHHYHLNPKDSSVRERLNAERVMEAMKAELKKFGSDILGELSYQNTEHVPLREFIEKIAAAFLKRGKRFIFIVDGLDHVIREGEDEDNLREFLNEVLFPQPGLHLIFGTQEMAFQYFPNIVFNYCPRNQWLEIKGLRRNAAKKLILKHKDELILSNNTEMRERFLKKLYEKSAGNPLYLRYILSQLSVAGQVTDVDDLDEIPPYKDEIKNYYGDLWRKLPVVSKSMCFTIACMSFKLQEEELLELSGYFTRYSAEVITSYDKIKHLIKIDLFGISVYHNSFLVFLLDQQELLRMKTGIYKQIRRWLKNSKDNELKWFELIKIEYFLGNVHPLFSVDKHWIIKSFIGCHDQHEIGNILDLATEAAFKKKDFKRVIYYRTLKTYFANREYNLFDTLNKIWVNAFGLMKNKVIRYPDFSRLGHAQIKETLLSLREKQIIYIVPDEARDRFNELLADQDNERNEVIESWIEILAGFDNTGVKEIVKFLAQTRANNKSASFFRSYCAALLKQNDVRKIRELLREKLQEGEKLAMAHELIEHDLIAGNFTWKKDIKQLMPKNRQTNIFRLYLFLSGQKPNHTSKLSPYSAFPVKIEFHSASSRTELKLYTDNFYTALFLCFTGKEVTVLNWMKSADSSWPIALMISILKASMYLVECLKTKQRCQPKTILEFFDFLTDLDFYDDHDIYELKRGVIPEVIKEMLQLHTYFNIHNNHKKIISRSDCALILKSRWLYRDDWIFLFINQYVYLSDQAFEEFKNRETKTLHHVIIQFKDKAERFANLATIARKLKKYNAADQLNQAAASYLISYGHHKDMTLYSILRSIEICGAANSKKVKSYLRRIAPFVYEIENFTDGDETRHFLYRYADLLNKHDKGLLYNLYVEGIEKRDYYLQEVVFGDLLETLNLSDPIANAVVHTAVDKHAYPALKILGGKHKAFKKVLSDIQNVLGPIDYSENRSDSSSSTSRVEEPDKTNYDDVQPSGLNTYLDKIAGSNYYNKRHEQSQYLLKWLKHWVRKNDKKKSPMFNVLESLFRERFHDIDAEVLDFIYPFAFQYKRDFAFECIVWAHANSSSWSEEYVRGMSYSRERWQRVIRDFPQRTEQFFLQSINHSGRIYRQREDSYFIPIPKATLFFIDCNQLQKAERLTEYYIDNLPMLFPSMALPVPDFIKNERSISSFELLMLRFQSISTLVRERAGWHLADLLENDKSGTLHNKLLAWLKDIQLEIILCNTLNVIIKSLNNPRSYSYKHINVSRWANLIRSRCMMSDLLFRKIAELVNQELIFEWPFIISFTYNELQLTEEKFLKQLRNYLPVAYEDYLNKMQEESYLSVWSIWCNMYTEMCARLKVKEERADRDYGNERREFLIGRSTIFTDILRSTFFRLIDYLKELLIISVDDRYDYAMKNFQVDPSIWSIPLFTKPSWWPALKKPVAGSKADLKSASIAIPIKEILIQQSEDQILHLAGILSPLDRYYEDLLEGSFEVLPFGYTSREPVTDAQNVFEIVLGHSGIWYPQIEDGARFGLFENEFGFAEQKNDITLSKLGIVPLVSVARGPNPHMWQYYRWMYPFKFFHPVLLGNLKLNASENGIRYFKGKKIIGRVVDFADGVRDRATHLRAIPAGNYTIINKSYLNGFLQANKLSIGFVVKFTFTVRDYSFSEEHESLDRFELIFDE